MHIEQAVPAQLEALLALYRQARNFMRTTGNPDQWGTTYPEAELVRADIAAGHQYVCMEDGQILATFFYARGDDPTYQVLDRGQWLNEHPYAVTHRVCAAKQGSGVGRFCLDWCFAQCGNLKIDTHRQNLPMQHLLEKCGFTLCGELTLPNGSQRLAYQKTA